MIKIENAEVTGFMSALRGMRNPMNSWHLSDSFEQIGIDGLVEFVLGNNDRELCERLIKAGTDHRKFLRMITCTFDVTAPMYWYKEFDTYKVGTVRDSCSTMHKIHANELTMDDFSHEHLIEYVHDDNDDNDHDVWVSPLNNLDNLIYCLNLCRQKFLSTKDKSYWWQMIQLLPSSYNQKSTISLNYEVLRSMYHARQNHKLDEWHTFCNWVEKLPYADVLITGEKVE